MTWVVATLVYVIAHFTLYALALRRVTRFSDERVIFGYHLVSS
jgi:hypothetical protein